MDRARELLEKSKVLAETPEAVLAEAFIIAGENKDSALALLASMNTAAARSAALRIITNTEQAAGAIAWVERASLTLDSFDSEGKFFFISNELIAERWQEATDHSARIHDADFAETPALHHSVGMAFLMQVVPPELRSTALSQIPLNAASFPLAADPDALTYRQRAIVGFQAISAFALKAATHADNRQRVAHARRR